MPNLGEIKYSKELGLKGKAYYIWAACEICNKERWTLYLKGKIKSKRCPKCCRIGWRKEKKEINILPKSYKPSTNEIQQGFKLGYKSHVKYIWVPCSNCSLKRWVQFINSKPVTQYCRSCSQSGSRSKEWKGGRLKTAAGYITVWIDKKDFFYPMANSNGRVFEHRLVMAKHLNRCLLKWEVVHHKNSIKTDNRIENLELIGCRGKHNTELHSILKKQYRQIIELQEKITRLEDELEVLKHEKD